MATVSYDGCCSLLAMVMNKQELDSIRERAALYRGELDPNSNFVFDYNSLNMAMDDIDALLAEVDRLILEQTALKQKVEYLSIVED